MFWKYMSMDLVQWCKATRRITCQETRFPGQMTLFLQVVGMFWNYMSVGMDAAAAHGFHQLRESRPWAARGRITNQAWCANLQID